MDVTTSADATVESSGSMSGMAFASSSPRPSTTRHQRSKHLHQRTMKQQQGHRLPSARWWSSDPAVDNQATTTPRTAPRIGTAGEHSRGTAGQQRTAASTAEARPARTPLPRAAPRRSAARRSSQGICRYGEAHGGSSPHWRVAPATSAGVHRPPCSPKRWGRGKLNLWEEAPPPPS